MNLSEDGGGVLAERVVLYVSQFHGETFGIGLNGGFGEPRNREEISRRVGLLSGVQNGGWLRFVDVHGAFRIEICAWTGWYLHGVKRRFGFDDAVPKERRD